MIEYVIFASAIAALSLPAFFLSLRKGAAKKDLDSAEATKASDELTTKEKIELDNYISGVLSDDLAVIDIEPTKQPMLTPKDEAHLLPNNIVEKTKEIKPILKDIADFMSSPKPQKPITKPPVINEAPKVVLDNKNFFKAAFKHGISEFVFNCEGEDIIFSPKKIFTYPIDYTENGVEGYLNTKNHTVIYAIKYSEYFWVILNNREKIKIPTKVCNINSANKITIPNFTY